MRVGQGGWILGLTLYGRRPPFEPEPVPDDIIVNYGIISPDERPLVMNNQPVVFVFLDDILTIDGQAISIDNQPVTISKLVTS